MFRRGGARGAGGRQQLLAESPNRTFDLTAEPQRHGMSLHARTDLSVRLRSDTQRLLTINIKFKHYILFPLIIAFVVINYDSYPLVLIKMLEPRVRFECVRRCSEILT